MTSVETHIGASVIDYIQRNSNSAAADTDRPQASEADPPSNVHPRCLIPCNESSNILLRGPRQSGRSSLAMNMAHSIAASNKCRGDCGSASCACVAVTILTPLQNNNEDRFPLLCNLVESSPQDFYGQLRALQSNPYNKPPTSSWNKTALRRIQVHRMASIRDVLDFLLSVQGKSSCPMGGIIVEDLDCFVRGNNNSTSELSTEQLMTMTQISKYSYFVLCGVVCCIVFSCTSFPYACYMMIVVVALLADTANTVRRSATTSDSFSVLATMSEGVPWNVQCLWSMWFPISLKIRTPPPKMTITVWNAPLEENERVEAQFVLEKSQDGDGTAGKDRPETCVAHFVVVRQNNGSLRIAWKRGDE